MKILRYILFLSILSGIFFVIYRQSDKNGFCRWRVSFKIAVLIAASAAGLILVNKEAMEPPGNNNQVYQERVFSDFYSSFDSKEIRSLPKVRMEDLMKTVPRDKVKVSEYEFFKGPGFIGAQKEPGTSYRNKETGQVHFVNALENDCYQNSNSFNKLS